MVGRSTGVERLVCFRWFHSLVEVEGPVVDTRAGCPRWLQVKELLQTRGPVALDGSGSGDARAGADTPARHLLEVSPCLSLAVSPLLGSLPDCS